MTIGQHPIVIVGAGHSGSKAAAALRTHGWTGGITVIGEENRLPYDRPPLSKAVLLGKKTGDQCAFFPQSWYSDNAVDLLLGQSVLHIDRERGEVIVSGGWNLPYDRLLLATGSSLNPLTVSGADLANVWPLRTPGHSQAIASLLAPRRRIVVIGAGVIGLEVAAAAAAAGCKVHVLEVASQAMGRSVPSLVADRLIAEHRQRAVDVRLGVRVAALLGDSAVTGVMLDSGNVLPCDAVIYGVGVKPRTELAQRAGLAVDNGIRTDAFLRTEDERIYACGDVCSYDSQRYGRPLRLENWRNAEDQADACARNMLGQNARFDQVPWFWSNQFDLTLQVAGLPALGASTVVETVGSSRLFVTSDAMGSIVGVSGLGSVREIASPIRRFKDALMAGA